MKSALEIPKIVRKASLSFELAVGRKSLNTYEFYGISLAKYDINTDL